MLFKTESCGISLLYDILLEHDGGHAPRYDDLDENRVISVRPCL